MKTERFSSGNRVCASEAANDALQCLVARAEHQHVLERDFRVVGTKEQPVVANAAIDGHLPLWRIGLDGNGEVHSGIAGLDAFEEVFLVAEVTEEVGEIERPGDVLGRGEMCSRRRDMAIAEMRPTGERAVEDHLGKLDRGMEAVHPLVRRFAGGRQLVGGALGNLVIAQITPLALRPLTPFYAAGAQELVWTAVFGAIVGSFSAAAS